MRTASTVALSSGSTSASTASSTMMKTNNSFTALAAASAGLPSFFCQIFSSQEFMPKLLIGDCSS
jgi:hypothetical protein